MGCDIHTVVQVYEYGKWQQITVEFPSDNNRTTSEPFDWRNYGMFGFLANVRNYSRVPTIVERRGLPQDSDSYIDEFLHSYTWILLSELLAFDYDKTFENRRCTRDGDGAALAAEGEGEITTFREFLGPAFFRDIEIMKNLGYESNHVRILIGFDN